MTYHCTNQCLVPYSHIHQLIHLHNMPLCREGFKVLKIQLLLLNTCNIKLKTQETPAILEIIHYIYNLFYRNILPAIVNREVLRRRSHILQALWSNVSFKWWSCFSLQNSYLNRLTIGSVMYCQNDIRITHSCSQFWVFQFGGGGEDNFLPDFDILSQTSQSPSFGIAERWHIWEGLVPGMAAGVFTFLPLFYSYFFFFLLFSLIFLLPSSFIPLFLLPLPNLPSRFFLQEAFCPPVTQKCEFYPFREEFLQNFLFE